MTARNKNIPALRFKAANGDCFPDWKETRLAELIDFRNGKGHEQLIDDSGKFIVVNSKFISTEGRVKKFCNNQISPLFKGEIVMVMSDIPGGKALAKCYLIDEDNHYTLNQRICALKQRNCDNEFLIYLVNRHEYYLSFDSGVGQTNLKKEEVLNCPLIVPKSIHEQQKIASFLSAIDEKIRQLTRRKELLEQYKKGVMQQLFSGKLRFKDEKGKAFPKWEEKLYEDIFTFYTTNSLSREKLNYDSGSVKNIHYGDIHTKFKTLFDLTRESVPFINDDVDLSKLKTENYCQEGDLVIADASEDYADIGKSIELVNLNKQKVVAGLHTFLARPAKIKMFKGFSGYLVQAPYVRKQIMTIAQGTKVLSLSPSRLGKVKLQIPSIIEQQKISSFLSSIDTKIESVNAQIERTKEYKKGLLQQMFV